MKTAIIALTAGGAELARRLAESMPEAEVFLPEKFRRNDACRYFSASAGEVLPGLFAEAEALVCLMATGIVVRMLAPHLRGKERDPAVVVADEGGRFAISLLSGHLGGANELAGRVAAATGGQAVVTTATDVNNLPAWDDIARRENMVIEPLAHVRILNSLLLEGRPIALVDRRQRVAHYFTSVPSVRVANNFVDPVVSAASGRVFVTHRHIPQPERHGALLLLRPRDLVVGLGCNRGTTAEEIAEVIEEVMTGAFLSPSGILCLATIAAKREEDGINAYASRAGLPVEYHEAAALDAALTISPPSDHARRAVGAVGVCEPAALLSSREGRILVPKQKRGNVTVAVAELNPLSVKNDG
ncbi:MAG: cobalamin biosynthesis protein [Desulfuromonadales bacterium]